MRHLCVTRAHVVLLIPASFQSGCERRFDVGDVPIGTFTSNRLSRDLFYINKFKTFKFVGVNAVRRGVIAKNGFMGKCEKNLSF